MKELFVLIESPDGKPYWQEAEWRENESVKTALGRLKALLGKRYRIRRWEVQA